MNEIKKAAKNYARFHGRRPAKIARVNFTYPKAFIYLGQGVAVEYRSDKKMHPRDNAGGKGRVYRHEFKKGVALYTDAKGRTGYIFGGKFKITDWLRG